jgi:ERCC4-related helicase
MLKFEPRLYQETIAGTAALHNTMVVLPTGLGKTQVAMMLSAQRLKQYPNSKVLVLAPTKPLVEQHARTFAEQLPDAEALSTVLTGKTSPEKRSKEYERATFIFSTPQTVENDLLSKRFDLKEVSLLVLDEAHRATGDYAYVYITKQYIKRARHERILALTASPGSDKQTIEEVIANTGAERVEVRTPEDPDVAPYVQETELQYLEVDLPVHLAKLKTVMERVILNRLSQVKTHGHIKDVALNKTQLLLAQKELQRLLSDGEVDPLVWRSLSLLAEVMKAQHALELLESQGTDALVRYTAQLERQAAKGQSKAVKNLVSDPEFRHVIMSAQALKEKGIEHPKLLKLVSLVKLELSKKPDAKIIVFSQYRDMGAAIVERLKVHAQLFVGQQRKGDTGMSQKEQHAMLTRFREGAFPVLVATSVGEEGLDIPAVDLVLFYEPVPSAIRTIQRRGRTGRHDTGRVVILVARGTRDVGYKWSAHHKEARMYRNLKTLVRTVAPRPREQRGLDEYSEELTIHADAREKGSGVLKALDSLGVNLVLKRLEVGDYLLSSRVCVEYKTAPDFVDSLLDGRLLEQVRELCRYQRPLIVVQGTDLYSQRNVHPNAIRGALSAVAVSFGVPILFTQNDYDTAELLRTIARRERDGGSANTAFLSTRPASGDDALLSTVAQFPGVGPVLAVKLLARFGSLKALASASVDELRQVDGIGKSKAQELEAFLANALSPKPSLASALPARRWAGAWIVS